MACVKPAHNHVVQNRPSASGQPIVIGLYGVPGCGKSFLLRQLELELGREDFAFYEGSAMIATIVPGGINIFQKLHEQEKMAWRQLAIETIGKECSDSGRVGIVTGHFMFWDERAEAGQEVYTIGDLRTFTYILYLDIPAEIVVQRRKNDRERVRPYASTSHLHKWQQTEESLLRQLCYEHNILFSTLSSGPFLHDRLSMMVRDFRAHSETENTSRAESRLDEVLSQIKGQCTLETVLVMDGDRTIASQDTGALFWQTVCSSQSSNMDESTLKTLFGSPLGYSYTAFRQAVLLYEETTDEEEFDACGEEVASAVFIHPEFVSLLQLSAEKDHVGAVIVTCGLRCVWDRVLKRENLSSTVKVIGGGRITDGSVVTATVKAALVVRLRQTYHKDVWAFGDSPLDLPMLAQANQAIVVVGEKETRSSSMDALLSHAIDIEGLDARQVLLPSTASPRLDTEKLPLVQLADDEFVDSVIYHHERQPLELLHATNSEVSRVLMTLMRNAHNAGPVLREAHRQVGWFLAMQFLTDLIGVEEYPIPHV